MNTSDTLTQTELGVRRRLRTQRTAATPSSAKPAEGRPLAVRLKLGSSVRNEVTRPTERLGTAAPTEKTPWRIRLLGLALLCGLLFSSATQAAEIPATGNSPTPGTARISVEATAAQSVVPLFYTADVDQVVRITPDNVTSESTLSFHVLQGRPDVLSLRVVGDGEITNITGAGIRDWSIRKGTGSALEQRFVDIRPDFAAGQEGPRILVAKVLARIDLNPSGEVALPLLGAGNAAALNWHGRIEPGRAVDVTVNHASEVTAIKLPTSDDRAVEFMSHGTPAISCRIVRRGASVVPAEFTQVQLTGNADERAACVTFHVTAVARVDQPGASVKVLSGRAALSGSAAGDGWHAELATDDDETAYNIVFDRKGMVPVAFDFAAGVQSQDDWNGLDFHLFGGSVVPVTLAGLEGTVAFDSRAALVLQAVDGKWRGFLPADGHGVLRWKRSREKSEAALFFTSLEASEIRVAAGLLRQVSEIHLRVMQGKLAAVTLRAAGPGEIVGVDGANVVGWRVVPEGDARSIEIRLSRPVESETTLTVRSQNVLADFPVRAEPLRLTPVGGVRHTGFVRIANSGAVRLEVSDTEGMMQLATAQYPGGALEAGARQVFVYRFPSAARRFAVFASQIVPEVGVSQITTYTVAETDRVIESDLELDVREAPLRDWSIAIPSDYAVVAVTGADVADFAAESVAADGTRTLKLLFARPVIGRELLHLRLEKSEPAKAGEWRIPSLRFAGAKSVRGHIGIVSRPGFRIVPAASEQLVEIPLTLFPRQTNGLQQAFRIRDVKWSAAVRIEALGQSIQSDVFHLYAVKQGAVSASVLINYFVVGAPATECRIEVPAEAGNIDVTGQGVRRDWRREGNVVVVSLHQPILGALTVLVTFEQPLAPSGGVIRPGEVRPLGVQSERGYVELVSGLELQTHVAKADGSVLKLEPLELPAELRLLTTAPALATYQYTARPFALEINVNGYRPGDTVDQIIDFAKFSSQVARDGQVVTEGRLFVKTRGQKMLRFQLPPGVKLWEARVDNELVTARADGDWTVLPLSARLNPNEPVPVALRLGQAAPSARDIELAAPRMTMPMVIGEWTLKSDRERLLVPRGGNAELIAPTLTETGFEWLASRDRARVIVLLLAMAAMALFLRLRTNVGLVAALVASAFAAGLAFVLANGALLARRANRLELVYASTVLPADGRVSIHLANLPTWQAMLSWEGLLAAVVGFATVTLGLIAASRRRPRAAVLVTLGGMLTLAGILAQRGGAVVFFALLAGLMTVGVVILSVRVGARGWAVWRRRHGLGSGPAASPVVSLLLFAILCVGTLGSVPVIHAQTTTASPARGAAESLVQRWDIREHRLYAEFDLTLRGATGDSFLLLHSPAVLTGFAGEGLHVSKIIHGERTAYYVVSERSGILVAHVKYELPVSDFTQGIPVLTGPAAVQRVSVKLDQPGWRFNSPVAVSISPAVAQPTQSAATLVLGVAGEAVITVTPQQRDLSTEATRFFAEVANLYVPGPGVVNATARITVRPAQGRVTALNLEVPEGFSVGDVTNGPVGGWQFDPSMRRLHVTVEPAQAQTFKIAVELQKAATALPAELTLQPVRVGDAAGQFGSLAIACGADAQPEQLRPTGMSTMSADDFDRSLLPRGQDRQTLATVQAAYRYSAEHPELKLRVAPVEPEVRVTSRNLVSLGDDRVVVASDLNVEISRVGIFQLSFVVPSGLDIEAVSGAALSHWTDATDAGERIITLQLNSKTIGAQTFSLTLTGPAPAMNQPWNVPQVRIREATRQTGELQVVPERGIRLRTLARDNASELDARSLGEMRPGLLAYRLLDTAANVTLGIEALEPWVTVQALEELTLREGQTLTRIAVRYHVENAAVKHLTIGFPGMTEAQAKTVDASGSAVSDLVPIPGRPGHWDIRFQRGIIGETEVRLEFQNAAPADNAQLNIAPPEFGSARRVENYVAVRGGGRLELEAGKAPIGWQRVDWSAVPVALQDRSDRTVPALSFRVSETDQGLAVAVRRHAIAESLKLRVTAAQLATVFSPRGSTLTAVDLQVAVAEKSPLRVRLPEQALLFNAFVNGESVPVVRDGADYLFHVAANAGNVPEAHVRFVYAVAEAATDAVALVGPRLNVPLENVAWRAVLPPGYTLLRYDGTLRLTGERAGAWFDVADYQAAVASSRAAETRRATHFMQTASSLLQQGEAQKAGEALLRATRTRGLDDASNEDARVQLRTLRAQQTVVGLNTRRQRLYLNNSAEALRNEQLEQAANMNPLMRGRLDFDPQQLDQLLMGNSVAENAALRGIADRMVDQQLAAEPMTNAIDVTLPERGRVVTFARSVQVNGEAPLELRLALAPSNTFSPVFGFLAIAAIAGIAGLVTLRGARTTP